jgi:hypothetical protein
MPLHPQTLSRATFSHEATNLFVNSEEVAGAVLSGDSVLAASIRHLNLLLGSFALDTELTTAPSKVWEKWAVAGLPSQSKDPEEHTEAGEIQLKVIPYNELDLSSSCETFDTRHETYG